MNSIFRRLRGNNRGSGIITVLIAMLFITALGSTLLFVSYTGLQIKISGRKSTENFYSAETAMSEIRSGVQKAVTQALAESYTDVLQNYSALTQAYEGPGVDKNAYPKLEDYLEDEFHGYFVGELKNWRTADGSGSPLFPENGKYDPDVLLGFVISAPAGSTLSLSGSKGTCASSGNTFSLQGISLSYVDTEGYGTTLSTDIAVSMPPFVYTPPGYSYTGMNLYSVIAKNGISTGVGSLTLTGSSYAGSINVSGGSLRFTGGTLTCGGIISVGTNSAFSMDDTGGASTLWTGDLTLLGSNSRADLNGDMYVADDLTLAGAGASVTLRGNYHGFGASETNSERSSSILINGRRVSLDMSGLDSLMLAGSSFISTSSQGVGATHLMGQSVAARSDQIAYLVPASCLPEGIATNPCVIESSLSGTNYSAEIMTNIATLAATSGKGYFSNVTGAKAVYVNLPSTGGDLRIAYFFLTFPDREAANAYFLGFFSDAGNKEDISPYLTSYIASYKSAPSVSGAGDVYVGQVDGDTDGLGLLYASDNMSQLANSYAGQYANRRVTLSGINAQYNGASDPYGYFVRTDEVAALPSGVTEFTQNGKVCAVIVNGSFPGAYSAGPDLRIIIATGDVTIPAGGFNGLVISGGTVTMNGSVGADQSEVSAAMNAEYGGRTVLSYLNDGSNTGSVSGGTSTGESWDVEDLVSYVNWKKS